MAMNEAAKQWVAALRSGEYQQCQSALRKEIDGRPHFCCLGVANEMSGMGQWIDPACGIFQDEAQLRATEANIAELVAEYGEESDEDAEILKSEEFTSPMVQEWLGLDAEDGELEINGERTSLARLNDAGKTFAEIADIIEQHADQLFSQGHHESMTAPTNPKTDTGT